MVFEGSKKDLERLDELHVTAWGRDLAGQAYFAGNVTRVRSCGRVHVWPGDPDDVAAALSSYGFRVKVWRVVEGTVETYFLEVLGR